MARLINPAPQWQRGGEPLVNGFATFFNSGTNTYKQTYKDSLLSIPNEIDVPLTADGTLPNCFFDGTARMVVFDDNGQLFERDPVGDELGFLNFDVYSATTVYSQYDIVRASNNEFYISKTNNNQNNDPLTSEASWERISFLGYYNSTTSYAANDVVVTIAGNLWKSLTAGNVSNNPEVDSGTNWIPAIDGSKIPEVITLEARTTTVVAFTGGGTLSAFRINELRDAGAYTLPAANSVDDGQIITITQPDRYVSFTPIVSASGADTITDSVGADTSITFDNTQSVEIALTSNGVSNWSL